MVLNLTEEEAVALAWWLARFQSFMERERPALRDEPDAKRLYAIAAKLKRGGCCELYHQ